QWDFPDPPIFFHIGVLSATNTTLVPWPLVKDNMRPSTVPADTWEVIFANFTNQVGGTWGDYVRMLNDNAGYLARLGENVNDIGQLHAFEFARADGLNVVRSVASATDAYVPTPGLRLSFERIFPQPISTRFRTGDLGRGWAHN